ncbi:MAG: tRNA pseudouridine(38-40) synthase TruA [Saprospiraceae bacterium]|nr:tRNA pseudouridine(38-40) synthase TruA [Saprospiraceae bacterium]MBL0024146.1 tRNA pseudouridine(38-40) synthase TruA [Saprospiraceae bacterium]
MSRYFIRLSYCGTAYNGWQNQPHEGTITVQATIEKALSTYLRSSIDMVGCGRTDTGVHAKDYYAHFDVPHDLDDIPLIVYRINKMLPGDIAVHLLIKVSDDAHARFDALSRSYEYHIHTLKSPFLINSYYYPYRIKDFGLLQQAADLISETDDFTTFCKLHSDVKTMICKITECTWTVIDDKYVFRITADRFLRGMIRLIVGMCLNVSGGKLSIDEVRKAIQERARTGHDLSVPAVGLYLCDIRYPYL